MSRNFARVGTVAIFFLLAACSGEVASPIAQATAQQMVVNTGNVVRLDGSASKDPQRRTLFYEWSFVSIPQGSAASLRDADRALPSFMADIAGDYVIQLVVSNGVVKSQAVTITIHVTLCGFSPPAVTVAQGTFNVNPTAAVQLSATASDPDNACIIGPQQTVAVTWSVVSRPPGSSAIILAPASANTTFTPDVAGDYQLQVVATDSTGLKSVPAFVNVTASSCTPSVSFAASLGGTLFTQLTLPTPTVIFTNCVATPTHTLRWSVAAAPAGSTAFLNSPSSASPTFTPDKVGDYQFTVVATNSFGIESAPAFLKLSVATCGNAQLSGTSVGISAVVDPDTGTVTPVPANPNVGARLTLTASFTDPNVACGATNLLPFSYAWSFIQKPSGSAAQLDSPTAATPSFVPDKQGTYQISVSATDVLGNGSAPQLLTISTSNCGANTPTVNIAVAAGALAFDPYTLTASAVANADDSSCPARFAQRPYTFAWSVISPPGASFSLSSSVGASTRFAPRQNATYTVQLVATGAGGAKATVTHDITVECLLPGFAVNGPSIALAQHFDGTVTAAPPQPQIFRGDLVTLTASGSSQCLTSDTFTFAWELTQKPAGSTSQIFSADTATPSFRADVGGGTYGFLVRLTDALGNSNSATFQVSVQSVPAAPAISGLPPFVTAGTSVAATVTGVPNGAYSCSATNAAITPPASGPLSGAGTAQLTLTGGSAGPLTVSCIQIGGIIASEASTATSQVVAPPRSPTITAPAAATVGSTYTASIITQVGSTYSWTVTSGSIVSAGGAAGVTSVDGKSNSIRFTPSTAGPSTISVIETNAASASALPGQRLVSFVAAATAPAITALRTVTVGTTNVASIAPRSGMTYTWSTSAGSLGTVTGCTSTASSCSVPVTAPTGVGSFVVSVTESNGVDSSATGTATIAAVGVDPAASSFSASGPVTADMTQASNIVFVARNSAGQPISGAAVTLSVTGTGNSLTATSGTTDATGQFSAMLTSTKAETKFVTATASIGADTVTAGPAAVTFLAGSVAHFSFAGLANSSTAGDTLTFTVVAVDQFQNVDSNYRGTVQFTSSDAQATFAHALHVFTADDAGVFTAGTVTLKTAASQTITAKDALVPTVSGTSTAVTVHPAAPAIAAFVQQPTNTTAGVSITPAVTVNVQDAFANNVPGASVTLSIAAGFNPGGGALTGGGAQITDPNGVATFSTLSINKSGTGYKLHAAVASTTVTADSTAFNISPATAESFRVVVATNPAATAVASNFTATARDAFNNVATGYLGTATFISSDAQAAFSVTTHPFTAGDGGVFTGTVTFKTVGSQTVTATDGSITGTSTAVTVEAWFSTTSNLHSRRLAVDAATNDVYAATSGAGVYRSTDQGATWSAATTQPTDLNVEEIAVAPTSKLYAATATGGVFTSTDNGLTWSAANGTGGTAFTGLQTVSIAANPADAAGLTVYVSTGTDVFVTADGGSTAWASTSFPPTDTATALAIDATGNVFAGSVSGAVYHLSTTGWISLVGLTNTHEVDSLAVNGSNLFAGTADGHIFMLTGTTWNAGFTAGTNPIFQIAFADALTGYAASAGDGVFKTTDGGGLTNWTAATTGITELKVRGVAVDATTSSTVFAGTDGSGLFKTLTAGQ